MFLVIPPCLPVCKIRRLTHQSTYAAGLAVLLITSIPQLLRHGSGLPGLIIAMIIISLGVGGVKSTLPPFLGKSDQAENQYSFASQR